MAFKERGGKIHIECNMILMNMHVICHEKMALGSTILSHHSLSFWGVKSDVTDSVLVIDQWTWHIVCVWHLSLVWLTERLAYLKGREWIFYELLMIRQGDIRVTGVLSVLLMVIVWKRNVKRWQQRARAEYNHPLPLCGHPAERLCRHPWSVWNDRIRGHDWLWFVRVDILVCLVSQCICTKV